MTAQALSREWTAVGGSALVLMGAYLALAADRLAHDHASWTRQWRELRGHDPRGVEAHEKNMALMNRVWGALMAAAGVFLFASAMGGSAVMRLDPDRGDARLWGLGLVLAGAGTAFGRAWTRSPATARAERAAEFCAWALSVLLFTYGLRLLREGLR
jgi:hypothetical protein